MDIRKKMWEEQMETLEQDMLPFGLIDDGMDPETITDDTGQTWEVEETARRLYY